MAPDRADLVRISFGTAVAIGLIDAWSAVNPSTAYLLTYTDEKCSSNCGFCPQARTRKSRSDMLSIIVWPSFKLDIVVYRISEAEMDSGIKRVCIQAMNYDDVFQDVLNIIQKIKLKTNLPISLSFQPIETGQIRRLVNIVDRISIPIDAASKEVFEKTKGRLVGGNFEWENQIGSLMEAAKILGKGRVTTHFVVGLGETDFEMINMTQWSVDLGILPSLFAFTPIKGTLLEKLIPPPLPRYRVMQIAHNLLVKNEARIEDMKFNSIGRLCDFGVSKNELSETISSGEPFRTWGCPSCDRPFYNEKVTGPLYNFPYLPDRGEIALIEEQIRKYF